MLIMEGITMHNYEMQLELSALRGLYNRNQ